MGRPSYVCTVCSEHFTRKYSARRHNQNLHDGNADIVRLIDYLSGRFSGLYTPNNPFWFKRNKSYGNIGPAIIPDTVADTYQPSHIPEQTPLEFLSILLIQYIHLGMLWMNKSIKVVQERTLKIEELKRLMNKHPQHHRNQDDIIKVAIFNSINHDDTLLDSMLEQFRRIDNLRKH